MSEETTPKAVREKLGFTQLEMAIRADVGLTTIQKYEAGSLINPQARIARKLSAAYTISDSHPAPSGPSNGTRLGHNATTTAA